MRNLTTIFQILFICTFAFLLLLPACIYNFAPEPNVSKENREITKLEQPTFTKEFFQNIESYFNDRFPFRSDLIAKNSKLKMEYFKASPLPEKVQIGKDGFLFINTVEAYRSYARKDLLTKKEIETFTKKIIKRDSALNANEISYYFGYFPNKHTVYFDKLPKTMQYQVRDTITLGKQLKYSLAAKGFNFFEPSVYPEREEALRYLKLDTHWSNLGSFQAYQDFFNTYTELNITPYNYADFKWRNVHQHFGDLTKLAGIDSINGYEEYRPLSDLKKQFKNSFKRIEPKTLPSRAIHTINKSKKIQQKKVLIFGDSYSNNMVPFYSLHFKEVIYLRDQYNQKMVDSINPDIVIEVAVERFLYKHL